jgi:hypothetical protein
VSASWQRQRQAQELLRALHGLAPEPELEREEAGELDAQDDPVVEEQEEMEGDDPVDDAMVQFLSRHAVLESLPVVVLTDEEAATAGTEYGGTHPVSRRCCQTVR